MTESSATDARKTGRGFLWLGIGALLLGIGLNGLQILLGKLWATWYVPVLATAGTGLIIYSLMKARTGWRIVALVMVGLLTALMWAIMFKMRLPEYSGPATVGNPLPAFTTTLVDGKPFTQADFAGAQNTVLVVFRGRW